MRKYLLILLIFTMLFQGCTAVYTPAGLPAASADEGRPIRIAVLKGPTAMGMAALMTDAEDAGDGQYDFRIVSAVDEIPPLLAQGKADIAAMPANLAAVLYRNLDKDLEVLAVNTLGVLYVVENRETGGVSTVSDLKGRTVYASGKGATPEYAFNYILRENGLDPETDLKIEWKSEHAECLASLLADPEGLAMLPQPFVTAAELKSGQIRTVLDLNREWDRLQEGKSVSSGLITGVIAARRSFVEEHREETAAFLEAYKNSVERVNADPEVSARWIAHFDIVPEAVAVRAIPACSLVYMDGAEMKEKLSGYLAVLYEAEPRSVGGELPDEDFYADF